MDSSSRSPSCSTEPQNRIRRNTIVISSASAHRETSKSRNYRAANSRISLPLSPSGNQAGDLSAIGSVSTLVLNFAVDTFYLDALGADRTAPTGLAGLHAIGSSFDQQTKVLVSLTLRIGPAWLTLRVTSTIPVARPYNDIVRFRHRGERTLRSTRVTIRRCDQLILQINFLTFCQFAMRNLSEPAPSPCGANAAAPRARELGVWNR